MKIQTVRDIDVEHKRVFLRVDFNVPLADDKITDDTRMKNALPTIEYLLSHDARVVVASHLGRPDKFGTGYVAQFSMKPVATHLSELLERPVTLVNEETIAGDQARKASLELQDGEIMMIENLRFDPQEKKNGTELSERLASLCDIYVDDAFGTTHRAHASMAGITRYVDTAVAGLLLEREVSMLTQLADKPAHPFVLVLGGAKAADKAGIVENLSAKADTILIGGAMALAFIAAGGRSIGAARVDESTIAKATAAIAKAREHACRLELPGDFVCECAGGEICTIGTDALEDTMSASDIGPTTRARFSAAVSEATTVFFNGPLGKFEDWRFCAGTHALAEALALCEGKTVVGGGDTTAAINGFGLADKMSFVSTGGGAALALLAGSDMPGLDALNKAKS